MDVVDEKLATGEEAEQIVQEEKKEVRYRKVDCESGFLTDEVEIGNFKIYQRRDIVENLMLGDYNDKGDYVLNSKVLRGLVGVRKEKSGDYGQIMFLNSVESFADKGQLKFSITISDVKEQEGYKMAVLKLLESVKKINGYIENTNSFIVASYKDVGDETFNAKVGKVFHIVDAGSDVGKDDPEVVNAIIERIKFLHKYKEIYLQDVATQEQAYYYARLELLKDPRFEEILIEYKKHLTKASMFIDPSANDYYAKLNELLDLSIDIVATRNKELGILANQTLRPLVERHNEICEGKHSVIIEKAKEVEPEQTSDAVLGFVGGGKGGRSKTGGGKQGGSSGRGSGGGSKGKGSKSNNKSSTSEKSSSGGLYRMKDDAKTTRDESMNFEDDELNERKESDKKSNPFGNPKQDTGRNL